MLGLISLPAYNWALPAGAEFGITTVDTTQLAFVAAIAGLLLVPVVGMLVRGLTIVELACMGWLLTPRGAPTAREIERAELNGAAAPSSPAAGAAPDRTDADPPGLPQLALPLPLQVSFSLLTGIVLAIIWAASGLGYFWPVWVWLGLAIAVALHVLARRAWEARDDPEQRFGVKVELCGLIAGVCWAIWALAGGGYLWPFWPMLGMATALAFRGLFVFRQRLPSRRPPTSSPPKR